MKLKSIILMISIILLQTVFTIGEGYVVAGTAGSEGTQLYGR